MAQKSSDGRRTRRVFLGSTGWRKGVVAMLLFGLQGVARGGDITEDILNPFHAQSIEATAHPAPPTPFLIAGDTFHVGDNDAVALPRRRPVTAISGAIKGDCGCSHGSSDVWCGAVHADVKAAQMKDSR